ncbi:MAG: AmmeMemoRadiSam system radical SAM enzyme [Syntrophomonadaceae bacterium]|nr:AmmeMemoRadiSam system radical SAM enzyme [Syntrophomonadaceae bacterium]MDD3023522.1 AmmeMemoRadiSam system radical SAM enzyme [Syntrophomonadaceae bacterium]
MPAREAMFYEKMPGQKLKCMLCPHHCLLNNGQLGLCRVRINNNGSLNTLNYGEISSLALDPIEKKPLYHFFPGKKILSAGTFGCNLSCGFCQNHVLAHGNPETQAIKPEALVKITRNSVREGSIGMAFTYNEPSIWYEYIMDTAPLLQEQNLKTVLVTNGYIEKEPLEKLLPFVDAMNIDVKAFSSDFYHHNCKGQLEAVKARVEQAAENTHVEITSLLITEENDATEEIREMAKWLASLNPNIPLHISRYHPAYKYEKEATAPAILFRSRDIAREFLNYVFIGNIILEENHTYCQVCGGLLIKRTVYQVTNMGLERGECIHCGSKVDYILAE